MRDRLVKILPWVLLAAIVVFTLSPLQLRPRTDEPPQLERFVAYALLGLSFALAFPRAWPLALFGLPGIAYLLELAQKLTPDRDWGVPDVEAKIAGSIFGLVVGLLIVVIMARRRRNGGLPQ